MKSRILSSLFMSVLVGYSLSAADYVVNTPTTVSVVDSTTYDNLRMSANLTIRGSGIGTANTAYLTFVGAAHEIDNAILTVENGAKIGCSEKDTTVTLGSGGQIHVSSSIAQSNSSACQVGRRKWKFRFSSAAVSDSGAMDVIRLGENGGVSLQTLYNDNPNVVSRVLFEGGQLYWNNCWENTGAFCPVLGATITLVSVNGNDIRLGSDTSRYIGSLCSGKGTVATEGLGNFVFWGNSNDDGAGSRGTLTIPAGIQWGHQGDVVLRAACRLCIGADDALPYGPGHGIVRLQNESAYKGTWLDLNGKSVCVNGVESDMLSQCFVTNLSSTVSTLVLGSLDVNGSLSGNVCANVRTRKCGNGSVVVHDAVLSDVIVDGGLVVVSNSVRAANVIVNGAEILVSNSTLVCASLALTNATVKIFRGGVVDCDDISYGPGGKIVYCEPGLATGKNLNVLSLDLPAGTEYVADIGAGSTATVAGNGALDDCGLFVKSGTLRMGGAETTDAWWRFTFSSAQKNFEINPYDSSVIMTLAIGRLHLFGLDGGTKNSGLTYVELNVSETALQPGQVTTSHGYIVSRSSENPTPAGGATWTDPSALTSIFDAWWNATVWTNHEATAEDPIVVTMRLAADKKPYGYLFTPAINSNSPRVSPRTWKVESRADDGVWKTVDERTDYEQTSPDSKTWENGGLPFLFKESDSAGNWTFAPSGPVQVAEGATLDLSEMPTDGVAIGALEVDLATGAGTITKFVPAEEGTVYLRNVTVPIGKRLELPLQVGTVCKGENLGSWRVCVNGEFTDDEFFVRRGRLCVGKKQGLVLLFR